MDEVVETIQDPRKEWVTPELKKVDLEQITAFNVTNTSDGPGGSS
jgi:hypothetical protein